MAPARLDAAMNIAESFEALLAQADLARHTGEHVEGVQLATAASRLAAQHGNLEGQARAQALLALHNVCVGNIEASIQAGERALALLANDDHLARSQVHCTMVLAFADADLCRHALEHAVAALDHARAAGNATAECWALNRLGLAYEGMRDLPRALEVMRESFAIAQTSTDAELRFAAANNITALLSHYMQTLVESGEDASALAAEAIAHGEQALALAVESRNGFREAAVRASLGSVYRLAGNLEAAQMHLQQVLERAAESGYGVLLDSTRYEIASTIAAAGRRDEALRMLEALLSTLDQSRACLVARDAHGLAARLCKQGEQFDRALHHFERFHATEVELLRRQAHQQSRILLNHVEIDQARRAVERSRLEAEMQRVRAEALDRAAHEDSLTGLLNRRFIDARLPQLEQRAADKGLPLAIAMLDLDHFKRVNDVFGHAVGDRVLRELGGLLRQSTRQTDFVARMGGEEFVVVFVDDDVASAIDVCERLRALVHAHPWEQVQAGLTVTVSIGVAGLEPGEAVSRCVERADAMLYAAKKSGRNRVVAARD
jgi:diguanylate cyclase (GGDEF)-like protein